MRDTITLMTKKLALTLVIILAFLGIADAWYLTQSALSDVPLICDVNGMDGCNIVAQSPYSRLAGVPIALYGVFFFSLVFVLAALALWMPRRTFVRALAALGVLGLIASVIFLGIQFFLIKAMCLYCIASALIAFLICVLTVMLARQNREPIVQEWEVTRVTT